MSERLARVALGVVSGLALLAALAIDLPRASDGRFWSDGATYHAMAGSLAFDGDLEFTAADLARVRASYPGGPQGVFIKRVRDGSGEPRLVYAKALVYPVAAAPLVRALGTDRGLLVLNALAFTSALWLGFGELRRASGARLAAAGAGRAAAGALAVLAGGVVPVYLLWQTPEIFNLALVTAGVVAWRRGWPLASAVLLGARGLLEADEPRRSRSRFSWSPWSRVGPCGHAASWKRRAAAPWSPWWWPAASASPGSRRGSSTTREASARRSTTGIPSIPG